MLIEVSDGEIVDKVTILKLKLEYIQDPAKLSNIKTEYDILSKSMKTIGIDDSSDFFIRLYEINKVIWHLEEDIRKLDTVDQKFIDVARNIHKYNDERAFVKKQINFSNNSLVVEEKSYKNM
jgi:hypothetical protein